VTDLLDNAIDSLVFAVDLFLNDNPPTAQKHATLNVFHAVELLLKEKLAREHPLFIYRKLDKPITPESQTVGLVDATDRLGNLGVKLSLKDKAVLKRLQTRRNEIMHYKFDASLDHKTLVAQALRFIYHFLKDHLDTSLEDVVSEEESYREIWSMIFEYEERLKEAESLIESELNAHDPKDRTCFEIVDCPECGNETVLIGSERGDFCFFCHMEQSLELCSRCCRYLPNGDFQASGICRNCFPDFLESEGTKP